MLVGAIFMALPRVDGVDDEFESTVAGHPAALGCFSKIVG